jgi:pimeloyl-ACP methyl ester carboxylesterase
MDTTLAPETIDRRRRSIMGAATITIAAAQLGLDVPARAASGGADQTIALQPIQKFATLKQIDTGILSVGYAEAGPADGAPVILLHGWPYDIHTYVDVAPLLASKGRRVIVPYLRGYGATRFLSDSTIRNGQQSALASDVVALMDALGIERATVAGCDWGARTANIVAALWPGRCKAMVSVSGYLIGNQKIGKLPLPPKAELQWWYQYYFATDRGRAGYEKYTRDFASSFGNSPRRNGTSMTPPSIEAPLPSTIPIMSRS